MKKIFALFASAVLILTVAVAAVARNPVDDPPPEPVDCPLCGGNPELHARKMLQLEAFQGHVLSYALRW